MKMKRRKASEEEHDVETKDWNGLVNFDSSPAPGPTSGPRMRAGRPRAVKQTSISDPQTPEPPDIGGSVLKKKLKKKRKGSQGNITFEKILHSTGAPARGSRASLTVPAWFIKEHGDELHQSVVLRSAASKQKWTVHLGVYYPRNVAQVKFYAGWRDFACSNGLDEGDLLVFCLRKVSQFDVYIYHKARGLDSTPSLPDTEPPLKRTKTVRAYTKKIPQAKRSGLSLAELIATEQGTNFTAKPPLKSPKTLRAYKNKNTKAKRSDPSLAELLATEDYTAKPISTFKPFEDAAPTHTQNDLPCFIKRIVSSNLRDAARYASGACLEIPRRFAITHKKQLQSYVTLHGISEGSPVHVVAFRSSVQQKRTRFYFRTGWSSFMSDNNLQLGQVLVFTLTAKSTFVVKDAPAS